jgi:signal transduction histidine kinase
MSKIAEAFSNFAKMPVQNLETLNIVQVVERALEIFSSDQVKFHSAATKIMATVDKDQVNRVITNLVKNAIQSVPESRPPNIEVVLVEDLKGVHIRVKDNGIGIEPSIGEKIFQPKFTTKTSGMGLGLPMVKNIIETYRGTISFETKLGEGTTFTVTFPKL